MKIFTYDIKKQKEVLVGELVGSTFYRKVNPIRHKLRYSNCYALQTDVYQKLLDNNVTEIIFDEGERKLSQPISPDSFFRVVNHGHGKQVTFSIEKMTEAES